MFILTAASLCYILCLGPTSHTGGRAIRRRVESHELVFVAAASQSPFATHNEPLCMFLCCCRSPTTTMRDDGGYPCRIQQSSCKASGPNTTSSIGVLVLSLMLTQLGTFGSQE